MTLPIVRTDTFAENARHTDTGCTIAGTVYDSCLACPLPVCKYDDPAWLSRGDRQIRDEEIARRRNDGERAGTIAKEYEVSIRTIHRICQNQREGVVYYDASEFEGQKITLAQLERKSLYKMRAKLPDIAPY